MLELTDNTLMPEPIDIWFAEISESSLEHEHLAESALSTTEANRLSRIRSPYKRREFLLSRALIQQALSKRFDHEKSAWRVQLKSRQTPQITNLSGPVFASLSHSNGLIGFIMSDGPVGIDLELMKIRPNLDCIAATTLNKNELLYLNQNPAEKTLRFYELWCSKEAIYKMLPRSEQNNTPLAELCVLQSASEDGRCHLLLQKVENYMLSIATSARPLEISQSVFPSNEESALLSSLQNNSDGYYCLNQNASL